MKKAGAPVPLIADKFGRSRTPVIKNSVFPGRLAQVIRLARIGPVLVSHRGKIALVLLRSDDYLALATRRPIPRRRLRRIQSLIKDLMALGYLRDDLSETPNRRFDYFPIQRRASRRQSYLLRRRAAGQREP